ncbi:MAG: RNA pseudouridine synthase [Lentisphaeria bacterium]|nr:RNA pseudouridine synthase [Lentisphaeria bacterium]
MTTRFDKIESQLENGIGVLYVDNHLLVVNKPAGMPVQGDESGDDSLLDLCKLYIKEKYNKPGAVFLGLVHRLDRPVSGVVVFARTSKSASRLSEQFRMHTNVKKYLAICQGIPPKSGTWQDYLIRQERHSAVSQTKDGKLAELSYRVLATEQKHSLLDISLKTGRHHQIRVQFSSRGYSLLGDFRYGSKIKFPDRTVALHAFSLEIDHPTQKHRMRFTTKPDRYWGFQTTLNQF